MVKSGGNLLREKLMNHIHERETIKTKKFIKKKTVERTWCVYCEKEKTQRRKEKDIMTIFWDLKGKSTKQRSLTCVALRDSRSTFSSATTCVPAKSLQSCLTLWDPMDCSPPGSSVHGILQVRKLEWVATPSSRASFWLRDRTHISYVSWLGRKVLYH